MKRKLAVFLFLAVLYILPASAQKCKYTFDKTDPITNERIRRSSHDISLWAKVSLYRAADDLRLELNLAQDGEHNYSIPIGAKIFVKLGDGAILELTSANEAIPVSFLAGSQVATAFAFSYPITKEQVEKIGEHGIVFIKAELIKDTSANYEVSSKRSKKIKKSALCIVQD